MILSPKNIGADSSFNYGKSYTREFVCIVALQPNWKLVANFNITIKNCSLELQMASLSDENLVLKNKIDTFSRSNSS